ncbi:MAG: branched-chain amino acid ABC transporter permease, partial [Alphaproteobacteria bacterium]|nr:branched-chain amino acid ABC transporter permease [Alphaproteobacteria bacterium]
MLYAIAVIFVGRLLLLLAEQGRARLIRDGAGALSALWLANALFGFVRVPWTELGWLTWIVATVIALRAWFVLRRIAREEQQEARDAADRLAAQVNRLVAYLGPAAVAFAVVMPFLPIADQRMVDLGILVLTYIMLGWGLNVVVGLAGLLDLGYVAFYAVGAYSYAIFSLSFGLNFWESLPLAGLMAAAFGVLLGFPVLRLRGDYLAIVTLGFGEMIRLILLNWDDLTNGAKGMGGIARPSLFGMPFTASPPEGVTAVHEFLGIDFAPIHRV